MKAEVESNYTSVLKYERDVEHMKDVPVDMDSSHSGELCEVNDLQRNLHLGICCWLCSRYLKEQQLYLVAHHMSIE